MIFRFHHLSLWAIALSLSLISPRAFGQITSATVTGSIVDASSAAVPGATVNLTNVNTGVVSAASTNARSFMGAVRLFLIGSLSQVRRDAIASA
ncbi:hypothetical protein ACPOL_4256 [Acidisarcina polymorpha]|uniref:Uncharacterized protein n=1 Tax=Acidisarcina polymorpha TaxID=2211140 RepID=A0A2Z5G325_9BACT|nr:carboxypeptidase-like regulatory domain-containing protein [Acidisarcina polymorpha]AXC13531.1 hypothetical protein ACPOL_4256 [Acidisarcina polymorpha]